MRITSHFCVSEFERSQAAARAGIAIHVLPGTDIWQNLQALCLHVLEPMRAQLGKPLIISSGYRPEAVNDLIGGAPDSQHTRGQAADHHTLGMSDFDLAVRYRDSALPFDQLIYEFGRWVHVSYSLSTPPRRDVLTAYYKAGGGVGYVRGIVPLATIEGAAR